MESRVECWLTISCVTYFLLGSKEEAEGAGSAAAAAALCAAADSGGILSLSSSRHPMLPNSPASRGAGCWKRTQMRPCSFTLYLSE